MKIASLFVAGLVFTILPIASANAEQKYLTTTTGNCSTTTWPTISPVQCTKPKATSYVDCTTRVKKNGSTGTDAWWWCSNQGFKS